MRDLRIQSRRAARTGGGRGSNRRPLSHLVNWIFERFWPLRTTGDRLVDHRYAAFSSPHLHSFEGQSALDFGARRITASRDLRASRESFVSGVRTDGLRVASSSLGLAHDADNSFGYTPLPAKEAEGVPRARLETDDPELVTYQSGSFGSSQAAAKVLLHRLKLGSRGQVADFVRNLPVPGGEDFLRAVFVDEDCRYVGNKLIASNQQQLSNFDPVQVLEAAFLAHAAGVILARGSSRVNFELSPDEVIKARKLKVLGESLSIYVLDYVILGENSEHGLFALHPRGSS